MMTMIGLMGIPSVHALDSSLSSSSRVDVDYNKQVIWQQNNLWHLGKNLSVGDSYTYKICDPNTMQTSAANYHYFTQGNKNHNSSVCYTVKMDFVNLLNSDENQINNSGNVWVVQAAISSNNNNYSANRDGNDVRYAIFHVDAKTFEVSSADTIHPDIIKYTDSLQDTLFSLFKYTASEPQLLHIGTQWGEVTEALREKGGNPYMKVLDDNQRYTVTQNNIRLIDNQNTPVTRDIADVFKVGYEIDIIDPFIVFDEDKKKTTIEEEDNSNNVTNYFLVSSDLPFPLSAVSYSPVHVTQPQKQYEFELIEFLANSKNADLETKPVVVEPKDIVVVTEIPTETGTIKLTFPDEEHGISSNDDVGSVEEDVVQIIPDNNDVIDNDDTISVDDNDDINTISIANDDNPIQSNDNDYVEIVGLGILLVAMIAVFVVFKKLKESGLKMSFKNTLKKKRQLHTTKDVVQFDDKLNIDIKTITDGN